MTTKQLGNIGEAKTLAKFVEMMIPTYVAFGDNEKSDLIADFKGKLNRIQVKTSQKCDDGKITIDLTSSTKKEGKRQRHIYSAEEIDYFSVYNLESDTLLLFPISEFEGKTAVTFRVPYKPSNNQYKSVNWEDYTFDKIICVETLHETPNISSDNGEDKVQTTTE